MLSVCLRDLRVTQYKVLIATYSVIYAKGLTGSNPVALYNLSFGIVAELVYCNILERCRSVKRSVSSNLTDSSKSVLKGFYFKENWASGLCQQS